MAVAITGAAGFIARHLDLRLRERGGPPALAITRATSAEDRRAMLREATFVFHLAGVNRPADPADFATGNAGFTETLCAELRATGRAVPLVFSSSTQAELDNPYGRSKRDAEGAVERYAAESGAVAAILRLPNVFGKWARPHYNSAVATFCHLIARGEPITVNDPAAPLTLVHVDDVVEALVALLDGGVGGLRRVEVSPVHRTTVGEVAARIQEFAESRRTLIPGAVGTGFLRALYSTYVSYLPPGAFAYPLKRHEDPRGAFAEMLRTPDAGQFSFFTAGPGITRGGHYHHTKTEKFLVLRGRARFRFRHLLSGERQELEVTGEESRVVESVPGWAHDVTNIGEGELIVMLWANEAFDPQRPDTVSASLDG